MTLPPNVDELLPLSPMQHLMLLHALASDGNGTLLSQVCYDVRGELDADALRHALETLVARHSALRAAFLWEGLAQPLQAIRSGVALPYRLVDLSDHPPAMQAERADALRREDAEAPMALGRAPLMRCTLVRCAADHHLFFWSLSHLVVDRWSFGVLLGDLRVLYAALRSGSVPALPEAAPFREYLAWVAEQDRSEAERFWREELEGFREPSLLRAGAGRGRTGARVTTSRALSAELSTQVRSRAAQWRTTPAGMLLAAIALLLARRTGQLEVLCGVTVSGRPPQLESAPRIVGSLVANLPARIALPGEAPLGEWVREVQRAQVRRQSFAHVSPADIASWSAVPTGPALYDTLVLINAEEDPAAEWPGVRFAPMSATLDAGVPFLVAILVGREHLELRLVHDAGITDAEGILRELEASISQLARAAGDAVVGDLLPRAEATAPQPSRAAPPPSVRGVVNPGDGGMAAQLLQVWRSVLGIETLGLDDDFFAIGGSSLQAAQLFARMEPILGATLPLSTLFEAGSIRALVARVGQPLPRGQSLVGIRSSGSRPPLLVVPGIAGNVVGLSALARAMGSDQPVLGFEAPGLDGKEEPLTSIDAIADRYVGELRAQQLGPFHLLGICFGAAVAFEMAIRLRAEGRSPESVILLDPAVLLRDTAASDTGGDVSFLRGRLELYWDEFRSVGWSERARLLRQKAQRAVAVLTEDSRRKETQAELIQARVTAANTLAVTRYLPGRYQGKAHVFRTVDRDLAGQPDPREEWRSLITPEPGFTWVGGATSGEVLLPPNVAGFAALLGDWLDAGEGHAGG